MWIEQQEQENQQIEFSLPEWEIQKANKSEHDKLQLAESQKAETDLDQELFELDEDPKLRNAAQTAELFKGATGDDRLYYKYILLSDLTDIDLRYYLSVEDKKALFYDEEKHWEVSDEELDDISAWRNSFDDLDKQDYRPFQGVGRIPGIGGVANMIDNIQERNALNSVLSIDDVRELYMSLGDMLLVTQEKKEEVYWYINDLKIERNQLGLLQIRKRMSIGSEIRYLRGQNELLSSDQNSIQQAQKRLRKWIEKKEKWQEKSKEKEESENV